MLNARGWRASFPQIPCRLKRPKRSLNRMEELPLPIKKFLPLNYMLGTCQCGTRYPCGGKLLGAAEEDWIADTRKNFSLNLRSETEGKKRV
jgi:hypothetical protein